MLQSVSTKLLKTLRTDKKIGLANVINFQIQRFWSYWIFFESKQYIGNVQKNSLFGIHHCDKQQNKKCPIVILLLFRIFSHQYHLFRSVLTKWSGGTRPYAIQKWYLSKQLYITECWDAKGRQTTWKQASKGLTG